MKKKKGRKVLFIHYASTFYLFLFPYFFLHRHTYFFLSNVNRIKPTLYNKRLGNEEKGRTKIKLTEQNPIYGRINFYWSSRSVKWRSIKYRELGSPSLQAAVADEYNCYLCSFSHHIRCIYAVRLLDFRWNSISNLCFIPIWCNIRQSGYWSISDLFIILYVTFFFHCVRLHLAALITIVNYLFMFIDRAPLLPIFCKPILNIKKYWNRREGVSVGFYEKGTQDTQILWFYLKLQLFHWNALIFLCALPLEISQHIFDLHE